MENCIISFFNNIHLILQKEEVDNCIDILKNNDFKNN